MSTYPAKQLDRDLRRLRHFRAVLIVLLIVAAAVLVRVPLFSLFADDVDVAHATEKSSDTAHAFKKSSETAHASKESSETAHTSKESSETAHASKESSETAHASKESSETPPPPVPGTRGQSPAAEQKAQVADEKPHSNETIGGDEGDPSSGPTPPVDWRRSISLLVPADPADNDSERVATATTNSKKTTSSIGEATLSPAVVVEPATAHPSFTGTTGLLLHNPKRNRVQVNYVVAGVVYSLSPGEWHALPSESAMEVVFDGGGDFGVRRQPIRGGVFVFRVSVDRGWELLKD